MDHGTQGSQVLIVAVAGGTCSGKSTLCQILAQRFNGALSVIALDNFYPDRSRCSRPEMHDINWDDVSSLDIDLIELTLTSLVQGKRVTLPAYDSVTHERTVGEQIVSPQRGLLVDGLHAITIVDQWSLHGHRSTTLLRIFVNCRDEVRWRRRSRRELLDSTVPGDFRRYWLDCCQPTFISQVLPQRSVADVSMSSPFTCASVSDLYDRIAALFDGRRRYGDSAQQNTRVGV